MTQKTAPWLVLPLAVATAAFWLMAPGPLRAADAPPPKLDFPLPCTPGKTCWIVHYPDLDPTMGIRDYYCGMATYNGVGGSYKGHKGTDIAIRDESLMRRGFPVLAAAGGVVKGLRDGMRDISLDRLKNRKEISKRECGNGVLIRHKGGWETQYCHMRKGSITVRKGQAVKRGQRLGLVGLSGATSFPHLHIEIRHRGVFVDPFAGPDRVKKCGIGRNTLWKQSVLDKLPYRPTAIYMAGFAAQNAKDTAARKGLYQDKVLPREAPTLSLWGDIFWVNKGDRIQVRIVGPDGKEILNKSAIFPKTRVRSFVAAAKKRKTLFWPQGTYRGEIILTRGNKIYQIMRRKIIIR